MNQFEINVSDLRRTHASEREVDLEATVDWALELSRVEASSGGEPNIDVVVTITPVGGGLMAAGEADFDARHTCHRCLNEWTEPMVARISAMFSARAAEDDEGVFLLADTIDLETPIRDDVLLSMPLIPTCPDGCAPQLVGTQENGLNTSGSTGDGSVDGNPEDADGEGSPFSVLRDLLDPGD
ncbi:MAG: DUF177 domain-containing protein [bacterium]|nr:DUF177 domain-containing protein [bacterium]